MRMHLTSTWTVFALLLAASVLFSGCGGNHEPGTSKPGESYSKYDSLTTRLDRLQERLDQLEREMDTQRKLQGDQIAAAKEDVSAIRSALGAYSSQLGGTSETLVLIQDSRGAVDQQARQRAENRVLTTLLLLVFIGFVIVFAAKLWRDKTNGEPMGTSPSSSSAASDEDSSEVYYTKEEGMPTDEGTATEEGTPKPPEEEK